jgi:hypothetical protein
MTHKHDWEKATTTDRTVNLDFWICVACGKISPGPTDNEYLTPAP